jgi:hypothetical protein
MNTIGNIPATKQEVETAVEHAIDKLALMINEGFNATASKEDVTAVKADMTAMEDRLTTRLNRIEHLLLEEQKRKIEDLEARMKRLEDALAV